MIIVKLNGTQFRQWRTLTSHLVTEDFKNIRQLKPSEEKAIEPHIERAKKHRKSLKLKVPWTYPMPGDKGYSHQKEPRDKGVVELDIKLLKTGSHHNDFTTIVSINGKRRATNREIMCRVVSARYKEDVTLKRPNNTNLKIVRYVTPEEEVKQKAKLEVDFTLYHPEDCPKCQDWKRPEGEHNATCPHFRAWSMRDRPEEFIVDLEEEGNQKRKASLAECVQADAAEEETGARIIDIGGTRFAVLPGEEIVPEPIEEPKGAAHKVHAAVEGAELLVDLESALVPIGDAPVEEAKAIPEKEVSQKEALSPPKEVAAEPPSPEKEVAAEPPSSGESQALEAEFNESLGAEATE